MYFLELRRGLRHAHQARSRYAEFIVARPFNQDGSRVSVRDGLRGTLVSDIDEVHSRVRVHVIDLSEYLKARAEDF